MSLVVARTVGKQLAVIADTKITYCESDVRSIKPDHGDGVIKVMILSKNLCVAFAGKVEYAESAIKQIEPEDSVGNILEILLKAHRSSGESTAFLLLTGEPYPTIYAIKHNKVESAASAWIGDENGFNLFQEYMMNPNAQYDKWQRNSNPQKSPLYWEQTGFRMSYNLSTELFVRMSAAMDYVIADNTIPTVGGYQIMAIYDGQFVYNKYFNVKLVDDILKGGRKFNHGIPEISPYSINFFGSSENYRFLALHILQGNLGIVYKRIDNGLIEPESMLMDEMEFAEFVETHYQIRAFVITQDSIDKYVKHGIKASLNGDFAQSVRCFDKALEELKSRKGGYVYQGNPTLNAHAEILFFKGMDLLQLGKLDDGFDALQAAIDISPSIEPKIRHFLDNARSTTP